MYPISQWVPPQQLLQKQPQQFNFSQTDYPSKIGIQQEIYLQSSQSPQSLQSPLLSPIELKNIDELKSVKLEPVKVKVESMKEKIEKKEKSKLFTQFVMLLWLGSIKGYKKSYLFLYWIYNTHIDDIHDDSLKYISEYYYFHKIFPPGLVYHPIFKTFNILEPIKEMTIEEEKQHDSIIREVLQSIISNPEKNSMQSNIVAENVIEMFL